MEENKKEQAYTKPTYEQLNDYVNQLMMQNRQLAQKLSQVMDVHTKLPYLFKVLKYETFFDADFVNKAVTEITEIMAPVEIPEEQPNETTEE